MKNRKLRICYFLPISSAHSRVFLDSLSDRGHRLFYFCYKNKVFKDWDKMKVEEEIIEGNSNNKWELRTITKVLFMIIPESFKSIIYYLYYLRFQRLIKKQLFKISPDILHAHYISRNGIYAYLSDFEPYVLTIWGSDIRTDSFSKYQSKLFNKSLENAAAVTSGSKELLRIGQEKGAKFDLSYFIGMPGIKIEKYNNIKVPYKFYQNLDIPNDSSIIFSPRAMDPLYRINIIIEAFCDLCQLNDNLYLIILDYSTVEKYLSLIKTMISTKKIQNKVRILSNLPLPYPDFNLLYAISSITISIPKTDGMPKTIYESFAAGCPVIASDLTTYDGIIDHEQTGLRVSGDNAKELSDAVLKILNDKILKKRIINNGKDIVSKYGNIDVEMEKMEKLYYSLANNYL